MLAGHEPYPAVLVNRWWELVDGNAGLGLLTEGCAAWLLEPPVNVLRLALHPDGMAPRIGNLAQWRGHLLTQLRHRAQALGDQRLRDLRDELLGYPGGMAEVASPPGWCCRCATGAQARNCRCSASARWSAPRPT